jgi:hypothetical protein
VTTALGSPPVSVTSWMSSADDKLREDIVAAEGRGDSLPSALIALCASCPEWREQAQNPISEATRCVSMVTWLGDAIYLHPAS